MNECITFTKKPRKLQIDQYFVGFQLAEAAPVCRAGGKPSTGFPPGTRRAEPTFKSHSLRFLHRNVSNLKFQDENEFPDIFLEILKLSSFFIISENT